MKCTGEQKPVSDRKRRCSGVTLVEVILAAAIVAILAVVAVTALMRPTQLVISDARRQIALHEAGTDMERVKAMSYNDPDLTDTNYSITTVNKTLNLARIVDDTDPDDLIITVTVTDDAGDLITELITGRTP